MKSTYFHNCFGSKSGVFPGGDGGGSSNVKGNEDGVEVVVVMLVVLVVRVEVMGL